MHHHPEALIHDPSHTDNQDLNELTKPSANTEHPPSSRCNSSQPQAMCHASEPCAEDAVCCAQVSSPVTHLAWAHPENGYLLAGGSAAGTVGVWEAPRPRARKPGNDMEDDGEDMDDEMQEWQQVAELKASSSPIRWVGSWVGLARKGRREWVVSPRCAYTC